MTVLGTPDVFAQSEDVPVSFTLEAPEPTCRVTKLQDINFGVLGRPAQGIDHGNGVDTYGAVYSDERFEGDILRYLYGVTKEGAPPRLFSCQDT